MNDKRIEDILRDAWKPEPPERLRDKAIGAANRELTRKSGIDWHWMFGWKPALAALGVAIILFTNIAESQTSTRIAAMVGESESPIQTPNNNYLKMRRDINELVALAPSIDSKELPGGRQ